MRKLLFTAMAVVLFMVFAALPSEAYVESNTTQIDILSGAEVADIGIAVGAVDFKVFNTQRASISEFVYFYESADAYEPIKIMTALVNSIGIPNFIDHRTDEGVIRTDGNYMYSGHYRTSGYTVLRS